MSASLVGSEMCIRDRAKAHPDEAAASASPKAPEQFLRRSGTGTSQRPPVSYTHLTLPTICSV
eukprot:10770482-Alexandrium_andersonii.AAC.1